MIEVMTSRGFAYAQVSHVHRTERSSFGPLLRVLPRFFEQRPVHFEDLVRQKPVSMMFCALTFALKDGICEVVGNVPVPEDAQVFPLFRTTNNLGADMKVKEWWFWDGEKSWFVGKIRPEQRQMPLCEIANGVLLRERVEMGWSPATDPASQ